MNYSTVITLLIGITFNIFPAPLFGQSTLAGGIWPYNASGHLLHGPFVNDWYPLNQTEALHFYTPYEICSLLNRAEGCADVPGNLHRCSAHNHGTVHHLKITRDPFSFFLRHRSTFPWPESYNIADLVKLMYARGSNTVFLVGDSLMGQQFDDMFCSSSRLGFTTFRYKKHFLPGVADGFEIIPKLDGHIGPPPEQAPFFHVLLVREGHQHRLNVSVVRNLMADPTVNRHGNASCVLIFNHGLHFSYEDYQEQHLYASVMRDILPAYFELTKDGHLVIFRETSAQHFPTTYGEYREEAPVPKGRPWVNTVASRLGIFLPEATSTFNVTGTLTSLDYEIPRVSLRGNRARQDRFASIIAPSNHANVSFTCAPLTMEQAWSQNWKNRAVESVLQELDKSGKIGVAPFFNITAQRHDLHVANYGDCTHFNVSPMLWAPLMDWIVRFYISRTTR
jgi:hypothetical protein